MTRARKERPKTPREEAPKLIGLTRSEAAILERAAELCEMPAAQFVRESALANARKVIGAK
jgi:uncharacterized protein (DUF1778 family)